jgi:MFS superfamily sulfate permease-like transporter
LSAFWTKLAAKLAAMPLHNKVLFALACTVLVIELLFRRFAPRSRAYARWTAVFQAIGKVWTAVLLAVVYFVSVALVSAVMKALGKDPLDRKLDPEPSFWRPHEANPLGPEAAARHQF